MLGDLGEVTHPGTGDQASTSSCSGGNRPLGLPPVPQPGEQRLERPGEAIVVEVAGDSRIDRDIGVGHVERKVVAAPLLAHVAQRVLTTATVELVQDHQVGEVDHVDLLQLARGAVLAGHHVHRQVHQLHHGRVGLADPGGLHDHQVETACLQGPYGLGEHLAHAHILAPGSHRPEVHPGGAQRVHPDPVTEQCTPSAPAGGVHGEHPDAQFGKGGQESQHELVDHRGLTGSARAGDPDHRR